MRHVIEYIDEVIRDSRNAGEPITEKELAHRMAVDPTSFSKWRQGDREGVNHLTLIKMQSGISDDPKVQAGLLAAYLRDQCVGPGKDAIRICVTHAPKARVREQAVNYRAKDAERVASAVNDANLDSRIVECLIRLIEMLGGRSRRYLRKVLFGLAEMQEE